MVARSWASIALFALLGIAAPGPADAGVAFGVRGGVSISGFNGDDVVPTEGGSLAGPGANVGPAGGLFLTFGVNDLLSIQPELLYVSKGASWAGGHAHDPYGMPLVFGQTLQIVDYLELPLLVRFTPPIGIPIRPVLIAGAAVSFELNEKFKAPGSGRAVNTALLKDVDFGASFGLGFETIVFGGLWSLEGRSTFGLTQLGEASGRDAKNWSVLVTLGFARSIG